MEDFGSMENNKKEEKAKIRPVFTEVELTKEKNRGSDCGVLSIEMLLKTDLSNFGKISIEEIESKMGKEKHNPSLPGDICRVLKESGYEVVYHSGIDWNKIADINIPPEKWDDKIKTFIFENPEFLKRVGEEKFRSSAEYLVNNIVIKKEASFSNIADMLRGGARIITFVRNGKHAIVITGIDEEKVYFNDPDTEPIKDEMTHKRFEEFWAKEVLEAHFIAPVQTTGT